MTDLASQSASLRHWLFEDALPLWWNIGADRDRGGFHEAIDLKERATGDHRRVRVQARQTYVYAVAGLWGWAGPWRAAVDHGLDYLARRYLRPDGLYRPSVSREGVGGDEAPMLYDQAFVLLALAAAYRTSPGRQDLVGTARSLLATVEARYHHDGFGFREPSVDLQFHADPHMHMFEAALAWDELDADGRWSALADRLGELALIAFLDPANGAIREYFDSTWGPAAGASGRIVEPGHQFEWASLLFDWGRIRGRDDAVRAASRLFRVGAAFGVDRARGVAFHSISDGLAPLDRSARLWPQTEWARAAVTLSAVGGDRDYLLSEAQTATTAILRYLDAPVRGAWRERLSPEGVYLAESSPASSFYHILGAIRALARETGDRPMEEGAYSAVQP